jgi:hypothetical protein
MRLGRWLPALFVSAALTAALLVLSGAGAAANGPDLSSPQGIDAYLLSIGVNPASVVHQNGLLNYAGPKCPGKAWSCTTDTRVVQIAAAGGQNSVECSGESFTEEGQSCVVVQTGDDNNARCIERSTSAGESQDCSITQTGAKNEARVDQSVDQNGGSTQDAVQTATVTQTSDGAFNHAAVSQTVNQSTNDGTDQAQDAHQSAIVSQTATNRAVNDLQADQSQSQKAFGGTTQDQNATGSSVTDCSTNSPSQPNECANILQSSGTGNNTSHLRQSLGEDANAAGGDTATQQQGTFSGGMEGAVHQETADGQQLNDANQAKRQHLSAPAGATQTQFDPMYCCGAGSQVGGGMENISQQNSQDATEPDATQESALVGQSVHPDDLGSCNVRQRASNNADSATNSESLNPCPFLVLAIACTNGPAIVVEGSSDVGIQQELPPGCETFESTGNDFCLLACDVGPLRVFARPQG